MSAVMWSPEPGQHEQEEKCRAEFREKCNKRRAELVAEYARQDSEHVSQFEVGQASRRVVYAWI